MDKEIRWTTDAVVTFNNIIEYLYYKWTEKEIENFINATNKYVSFIAKHQKLFRDTNIKNVHEALVTPQNLLIYKIYDAHIDLITFWDTLQNPVKKVY